MLIHKAIEELKIENEKCDEELKKINEDLKEIEGWTLT